MIAEVSHGFVCRHKVYVEAATDRATVAISKIAHLFLRIVGVNLEVTNNGAGGVFEIVKETIDRSVINVNVEANFSTVHSVNRTLELLPRCQLRVDFDPDWINLHAVNLLF